MNEFVKICSIVDSDKPNKVEFKVKTNLRSGLIFESLEDKELLQMMSNAGLKTN